MLMGKEGMQQSAMLDRLLQKKDNPQKMVAKNAKCT